MVEKLLSVVRGERQDGVVSKTALFLSLEQQADRSIHLGYLAIVEIHERSQSIETARPCGFTHGQFKVEPRLEC